MGVARHRWWGALCFPSQITGLYPNKQSMKSLLNTILASVLMAILLYLLVIIVHYIYTKFGFSILLLSLPFIVLAVLGILGNLGMFLAKKKINILIVIIVGVSVVVLGFGIPKVIAYNHVEGLIKLSEESIKNWDFEKVSKLLKEARVKAVTEGQQKEIDYLFIEGLNGEARSMIEKEDYLQAITLAENIIYRVIYPESKQRIEDKIKEFETFQINKDQNNYSKGLEEFKKGELIVASDFFEIVSPISPYYSEAKNKFVEAQKKLEGFCFIKANFDIKTKEKIYYFPGCDEGCGSVYLLDEGRSTFICSSDIDPYRGERYFCKEQEAQERGWQRHESCPTERFSSEMYEKESLDYCVSFNYEECRRKCEKEDPIFLIKCEVCEGMKDACRSYFEALKDLIP